jgi:diadenosine tetraphosphate (Ap4A) HIT family hydrolase
MIHFAAMPCVFCEEPWTAGEILVEERSTTVILHDDWSVRGHTMIVAKRHVENLSELGDSEATEFLHVARTVEDLLLEETGTDRAILLKLGLQTPHLHLHIYPLSSELDRAAVMKIIDGKVRVPVDERFVRILRDRLSS